MKEKVADLVKVLLEKTESREWKWEETVDEDAFRTDVASNTVTIELTNLGHTAGGRPMRTYCLTVTSPSGKVILDHKSDDLAELHESAKWSARHTEKVIDALLQELRG